MNEIERNKISIYEFPDYEEEEENTVLKKLKVRDYDCVFNHSLNL